MSTGIVNLALAIQRTKQLRLVLVGAWHKDVGSNPRCGRFR